MRNNRLLSAVLAVLLPLSVQAGSLSRSLTDQEFTVAVPGQDSSTKDKSRIFKDALNRLTEKLSGGVYDSVNLNGRSIDYFVDNFGFRNSDLVVNFDRIKVMQLLRSQNIPLYLDARPDIMVWMSIYDEKYNVRHVLCCMGDYFNDEEMLRSADISVCPENIRESDEIRENAASHSRCCIF